MRFIANILTNKPFSEGELYNIVSEKDELIKGIPTLVIGWEFAKTLYPNANILNWEIDDNTYWTFGKRERGSVYEKNIIRFWNIVVAKLIKGIKYKFVNVITSTDEEKTELFNVLFNEKAKVCLIDDMVYAYNADNKVYGVSLRDIEYEGKDVKKFISRIYKSDNAELVNTTELLPFNIRNSLRNHRYIMPYLCS